jgi:hypothetical protein
MLVSIVGMSSRMPVEVLHRRCTAMFEACSEDNIRIDIDRVDGRQQWLVEFDIEASSPVEDRREGKMEQELEVSPR